MSEGKQGLSESTVTRQGVTASGVPRLVNCDATNQVTSRRTHRYPDCSLVVGEPQTELSEREAGLLGLSECKVCLKRAEGGPALAALTEILDSEGLARNAVDELRKRGFYLSQRSPKADS